MMATLRKRTKSAQPSWKRLTIAQRETKLRSAATLSELKLHAMLDGDVQTRGKFEFQSHLAGFYPDFLFRSAKLIVELDGACHKAASARWSDARRTRKLARLGYRTIRFWNSELRHPEAVIERIVMYLAPTAVIRF